ncbi:MAG TPA: hypothetical protein VJR87_00215 [Allosphingosinicella sp.]|nr:hypothetical protein [Allosphingosinicella sp.]
MSEPESGSARKAEARAAEAAAIRRRWITLGEILAVVAVLISALTLWLNWSERQGNEAEKAAESTDRAVRAATLTLRAERAGKGARLELRPASPDQSVQEQVIRFPAALGVNAVETTGEPRIESRWFDGRLKKAREKAGLPDDSRGDERLPVLIETRFLADGEAHRDVALYDIGYTIKGGMLGGHEMTLRGLSLVQRVKAQSAAAALDQRWTRLVPAKGD